MWDDETKDKTKSARIPGRVNDLLEERLEDRDIDPSGLFRWAIAPAVVDDVEAAHHYLDFVEETYDDPELQSWNSRVEYFLGQNFGYVSGLTDEYSIGPEEREEAVEGVKDIIVGVAARDYEKAMRGGEQLSGIDRELTEAASRYIGWLPDEYWDR